MNKLQDLLNLRMKSKDDDDFMEKLLRRYKSGSCPEELFKLFIALIQPKYIAHILKRAIEDGIA